MSFNNPVPPNTYTPNAVANNPSVINNNNNNNNGSTTSTLSSNITNITSVPGSVPQSSNNIHGAPEPSYATTTTATTTTYNTNFEQPAPPNPGDIIQIPVKMASAGKKKCNIAKFHTPHHQPVVFSTMPQPVKMYRAPEEKEIEAPPPKENPFFKKKHSHYEKKPVVKDPKAVPWRIEDSDGGFSYDGTLEGGQTSNYGLLVFENGAFTVTPIADWYNFKPRRSYQTYSTEEAEHIMNNRHEQARKRAEKMGQNPVIKTEGGAGGAGSSSSSGAPAGAAEDKEDDEFKTTQEDDDPDRFAAFGRADSDEDKKKKQQKQKDIKKEEGDSDNGEEPDWEGVFDDDEDTSAAPPEEAEPEREADNDGEDKDLTEAGKELRSLLKKRETDDVSEASDFGSDSDEEDDDDEDDFNLEEKLPFINPMLKLNSASADIKEEVSAKDEARPNSPPTAEGDKKKSPPTKKKGKKDSKDEATKGGDKSKKSRSAAKKSDGKGTKREGGDIKSPPTGKKAKTETPSKVEASPPIKSTSKLAVTEEEVKRVLSQGKRLRTLDLVNHFKAALADETQKKRFTELTRKLCSIVDEGGVKYLLLRPQFQ